MASEVVVLLFSVCGGVHLKGLLKCIYERSSRLFFLFFWFILLIPQNSTAFGLSNGFFLLEFDGVRVQASAFFCSLLVPEGSWQNLLGVAPGLVFLDDLCDFVE